jgi:hypothetical protein
MIMTIRFYCPECKKPLEIDDIDGGKSVICFYCNKSITTPTSSDPALVKAGESSRTPDTGEKTAMSKKSPALGIIGMVAGIIIILGLITLVGWFYAELSSAARTPEFAKMTVAQQKSFFDEKAQEVIKSPITAYAGKAISIVAIIGFLSSVLAIAKKAGRKFAVPGLIINGAVLLLMLMKYLPKK